MILITNDDGTGSPGLAAMAEAVMELGELVIAAPANQQTSMGRAFPRIEQLGTNLTSSRTVGALLEASTYRFPGIVFSIPAESGVHRTTDYGIWSIYAEHQYTRPGICTGSLLLLRQCRQSYIDFIYAVRIKKVASVTIVHDLTVRGF